MSIYDKSSLVLIPSGTKTGKVYSQKPVSGDGDFTFTRASAATRVNADGNIEKETSNLLLQSNSFNTTWATSSSSVTAGQSGYDGTNNAWQLTATNTSNAYVRQSLSFNSVQTLSVYAKANTADFVELVTIGGGGANPRSWFNLATGSVETSYNCIDTKIEAVSGGWYRCSITLNASITGYRIYVMDGDNSTAVTNGNSIYIQDAQLNQGLIAQEVITTTTSAVYGGITDNTPRLDYTDSSCPSLLLEPLRSNKFLFSEYYGSGALAIYQTGTNTHSVTNNYSVSPEGVQNAIRFVADITSVGDRVVLRDGVSCGGGNHTLTFYAKSNTSDTYTMKMHFDGSGKKQIQVTPEWQRFEYAESANTTCNAGIECSSASGYSPSVDVSVYGFQLEAGSYATSYIPTYGSSVTRTKDFINQNIQTLTSGLTEGTFFVEFEKPNTGENVDLMRLKGSGTLGRAYIYNYGVGFASDWGTSQNFTIGENTKVAWRLDSLSSGVEFLNGVKGAGGSGTAWSDIRELRFNAEGNGGVLKIKQILFFPTALTDTECITLTTL